MTDVLYHLEYYRREYTEDTFLKIRLPCKNTCSIYVSLILSVKWKYIFTYCVLY